jgi:hypothetical protein
MKPALHRSLTFWSGILVLISLLAALSDSHKHESLLEYTSRGDRTRHSACLAAGRLWLYLETNSYFTPGLDFARDRPAYIPPELPSAIGGAITGGGLLPGSGIFPVQSPAPVPPPIPIPASLDPSIPHLSIPIWPILLAVVAVWLLLLFLRAHRRSKSVITS